MDFRALLDYESSQMDLIDCNGRLAVNICSVGFDARIGLDMVKYKKLPFISGKAAYLISSAVNTIKGVHLPFRISMPDLEFQGNYTPLCSGKWSYYGVAESTPDAEPDDGIIDILLSKGPVYRGKLIAEICQRHVIRSTLILWNLYRHATNVPAYVDRPTGINVDGDFLPAMTRYI